MVELLTMLAPMGFPAYGDACPMLCSVPLYPTLHSMGPWWAMVVALTMGVPWAMV